MVTADTEIRPYIAVLLAVSSSDAVDYQPLYCEDVVLLHAASTEQAGERARQLGARRGTTYANDRGEMITWTLERVVDVVPTLYPDLSEDTELYSRHFSDIEAYERFAVDRRGEVAE